MISRCECRATISADGEAPRQPAPFRLGLKADPPVTLRGFTLVELLVCLAIMGFLLGVMPSLIAGGGPALSFAPRRVV